jgi:hypothetical protein
MQILHDDSERKSNPRALPPRVLSRHRYVRLRQNSPRREFRAQLIEPNDIETVFVGLAGGGCRTLQAVLDAEVDR